MLKAFQEVNVKIKTNQPILPHTAILECACTALKLRKNTVRKALLEYEACSSLGKETHSFHQVLL
jgi:hypothetical protein